MMRDIKAVLLDLDETLTDAFTGLRAARRAVAGRLHKYLREHGIELDEEVIYTRLREFDDKMAIETKYNRDEWWPELLAGFGLKQKVPRRTVRQLTKLYWTTFARANKPFPDAGPTLSYIREKGYKLGLITDTDVEPGLKLERVRRFRFIKLFNAVVISGEDIPETKPSPKPFLLLASKLGASAGECVVVGDKPFTDIKGAKAAGMRTIWLKRRDWGIEEKADFTINSLAELRRIL
ncbi:MAG: HAD-IA family hydrolase [Hadesarchaea archaeon]|nr:HAD-IA family hydrolase [Hadesarchaea archaeon]